MAINNYGLNAYRQTVKQGYTRLNDKNTQNTDTDDKNITVKPSQKDDKSKADGDVQKNEKIPPPNEIGRIMDFKI